MICDGCGNDLTELVNKPDRGPCPQCGSTAKTMHLHIEDTVPLQVTEWFDGKVTAPDRPKKKRLRMHLQVGQQYSVKLQKYVDKERLIDKDGDRYMERVTAPDTGEVLHHCEQSLKAHQGHGSAKFKDAPKDESDDSGSLQPPSPPRRINVGGKAHI